MEAGRLAELRTLLASMNRRPGVVDPENGLVPFGRFERLHFARFVLLDDPTGGDIAAHGVTPPRYAPCSWPSWGTATGRRRTSWPSWPGKPGPGFAGSSRTARGFPERGDLFDWMTDARPAGRHALRELGGPDGAAGPRGDALRQALETYLDTHARALGQPRAGPGVRRPARLRRPGAPGRPADLDGRPSRPRSAGSSGSSLHLIGVPLVLLLASPLLLLYLPVFLVLLRRRQRSDPEIAPRPDAEHAKRLAELEDHDVTNQFSAMGTLKPGWFRRTTLIFVLWIVSYTTRHIYTHGFLARVGTIHFARWTFLDDKQRLLFASNYDGSLESYMDDFINKVAFGLNVVFTNGVGYPRTRWLAPGRRQGRAEVQVLHPPARAADGGLVQRACPVSPPSRWSGTAASARGLEQPTMTDAEAREWLRLL